MYYPYSQSVYPQRVVIENDTVNLFTDAQTREILKSFINEEYLEIELEYYVKLVDDYQNMTESLSKQIVIKNGIIGVKDDIIKAKNKELGNYKIVEKELKKRNVRNIIMSFSTGMAVGILLILFI